MKIDTLGMQAFKAIADEGSFHQAAESLHLTQTALTRRLQNLEANLGVKLVERTTRSVALTATGRDFLPHCGRLLSELQTTLVELRESGKAQRGDISIACVPTVGVHYLPRIIKEYSAQHPHNRIRILDYLTPGVTEAVLRREAEFGIGMAGPRHPELESVPLLQDHYVLICRDDHPLAGRKTLPWKQLAPYPLIFPSLVSSRRAQLALALGAQDFTLRSYYEVERSSTAVGMVAEGVAAAVVPGLGMQKGAYPNVSVVALIKPVVSWTMVLLSRRNAQLSPAARALYDLLRNKAGKQHRN
jgi:DNA-binding transcriptional LysR family regulator